MIGEMVQDSPVPPLSGPGAVQRLWSHSEGFAVITPLSVAGLGYLMGSLGMFVGRRVRFWVCRDGVVVVKTRRSCLGNFMYFVLVLLLDAN